MSEPAPIKARLRSRMDDIGDLSDQGYATYVQSIDRIVLIPSDYPDITFKAGGVVTFIGSGLSYQLDTLEMRNGPLTNLWRVSQKRVA